MSKVLDEENENSDTKRIEKLEQQTQDINTKLDRLLGMLEKK
jgi:hypothetical protein